MPFDTFLYGLSTVWKNLLGFFFDAKMECKAFVLGATPMRNGRKKRVRKGKRWGMVLNKKRRSEK